MQNELPLRYGMNPHQAPARATVDSGSLPFTVLNGQPGFINLLDALNGWQLVRELRRSTGLPAATSFKHVSPAGAAVGVPLDAALRSAYFVDDVELSPLATAYARARGADRLSSFGDFVALSDTVDAATARLLRREVSDGVIAPAYDPDALAILKKKKQGNYLVMRMDPDYEPDALEARQVFGVRLEQKRNDRAVTPDDLSNVVTEKTVLTDSERRDLIVALITLKFTASNSIALARDGQVIGVGAGQQSRIHCTRLASDKADRWYLRQHPTVLGLPFRADIGRPERDNAIDLYLLDGSSTGDWHDLFTVEPPILGAEDRRAWLAGHMGVAYASDGFIPFRDNIDRAAQSGVAAVAQPGHSVRDADVIQACNEHGIAMAFTNLRLFHH